MSMRNNFTRSPSATGRDRFRIPLNHPDIEPIGNRIEALLRSTDLDQTEGGRLTRMYRDLRNIDRSLYWMLGDQPLPATNIRPEFPNDGQRPSSEHFGKADFEIRVGFVWLVFEHVEQLEHRSINAKVGRDVI